MDNNQQTPSPLAVSMGCPASIGPEIIVRLFAEQVETGLKLPNYVIVGDVAVLRQAASDLGLSVSVKSWRPGQIFEKNILPVFCPDKPLPRKVIWGQPDLDTARAMISYIEAAARGCMEKQFSGMVTCPISKEGLKLAGSPFPGHTEMLAHLTRTKRFRMMLAGDRLRVVLVTIHEPLARVAALLTRERIADCIAMTSQALEQDFGIRNPRIAVAGLNPHCGENGMFGNEEKDIIMPAVQSWQGSAEVSGPWPPDTVFFQAARGDYDAVVCMYHDQGLIPFKLLHFQDGVNVTLGLPIVRTSVDHGTAYDIAGRGIANTDSLKSAILLADTISHNRQKRNKEQ